MTKKLPSFVVVSIVLILGAIYYSPTLQSPLLGILNGITKTYNDSVDFLKTTVDKYFFQAEHIASLEDKLKFYEHSHLLSLQLASEIKDLYTQTKSDLSFEPQAELVRFISYQKLNDFNRAWLDVEEYDPSRIYGLVYKEAVAGIVIPYENRALALLNSDIKCTYSVSVGEDLAPGVAQGNSQQNIVVKYIPAWYDIKEGDEVVTSGLDEIFFKNLKVGKVVSLFRSEGYVSAVVEPYYKSNNPSYFYMIKKVK